MSTEISSAHSSLGNFIGCMVSCIAAAAKPLQSCPTLCDPIDGSPPGFPVPGILQARTLEWVAISFSSAWKWKVKVKSLSHVWLLATPWTAAYQAPLSMGFSRQEYWSGVPLPSPSAEYLWEFPLLSMEEDMATHSSILAWRISWAEEPGSLYSPWDHKELDTTEVTSHTTSS